MVSASVSSIPTRRFHRCAGQSSSPFSPRCAQSARAAAKGPHGGIRYSFLGTVTATPSNGGVSINVVGGNKVGASRDARRAGHADVRVRQQHRVPEVVEGHPGGRPGVRPRGRRLRLGARPRAARQQPRRHREDRCRDRRRPRHAALQARQAAVSLPRQADRGRQQRLGHRRRQRWEPPRDAADDRRRPSETFSTGDGTIFLLWQGKVPTVIDASKLVVGDRIVVRIRAARNRPSPRSRRPPPTTSATASRHPSNPDNHDSRLPHGSREWRHFTVLLTRIDRHRGKVRTMNPAGS